MTDTSTTNTYQEPPQTVVGKDRGFSLTGWRKRVLADLAVLSAATGIVGRTQEHSEAYLAGAADVYQALTCMLQLRERFVEKMDVSQITLLRKAYELTKETKNETGV